MTGKMSFGRFIWPHNPEKIEILHQNKIKTELYPFLKSRTEIISEGPRIIKGSGRITGDDAMFYAAQLCALRKIPCAQRLCLPFFEPFFCVLKNLRVLASSEENAIIYEFEFIEEDTCENSPTFKKSVCVKKGESLYDISSRTGVSIDKLMLLNPSISDPFDIKLERVVTE